MKTLNYLSLSFVLFLIASVVLSAQVKIGFKGGLNYTNIKYNKANLPDEDPIFVPMASWHLGMLAEFSVSEKISIQPELLFMQRGAQTITRPFSRIENRDSRHKLSYISMPVLLVYKLGVWSIEAGPDFAYLVDSRILRNGKNIDTPFSIADNKFDVSFDIGLKYRFGHFFTQLRWQHSLIPIGELPTINMNGEYIGNLALYPTAIQLSLAYQL